MPLVRVTADPDKLAGVPAWMELGPALSEIVPAVLHCHEGQLTPGSIEYVASFKQSWDILNVDVLVEVEAYYYEERAENLQVRTDDLRQALAIVFPDIRFAVWCKLVQAGWSSGTADPEFEGSMTINAALGRIAVGRRGK